MTSSLRRVLASTLLAAASLAHAQRPTYTNPVLFADYSDPDVLRDGDHFYLVASTFEYVPGLPILESTDLVHWTILTHALTTLRFGPEYSLTANANRYGRGVWAPALRKHNGLFYIYFPTPDEGIFVVTAPKITGPWSAPKAVILQPHLEDPCPFWDDNGNAYLVHSKTGAGPLILHRMAPDGLSVLDDGKEIVNDRARFPNLEGPKIYKRNGFYYIFAPIKGFVVGTELVLRSRSLYGPFEHREVLVPGASGLKGPHQGGYVETPDGKGWFMHFESRGGYGRIDDLEPVRWENDWPIMGNAPAGAIAGEPVKSWPVPVVAQGAAAHQRPQTSDDFSSTTLGPQWEWNHNPIDSAWSLSARKGFLRLTPTPAADIFTAHNTLTQQMQDERLSYTVRFDLSAMAPGDHTGLAMFEKAASGVEVTTTSPTQHRLRFFHNSESTEGPTFAATTLQLRLHVADMAVTYSYSLDDGKTFIPFGPAATPLAFSWWKASRPAIFAYTTNPTPSTGHIDIDWAHYTPQP